MLPVHATSDFPDSTRCKDSKEGLPLNTEHFVIDADPLGGHSMGNNALVTFQLATIKEVGDTLGTEDETRLVKEEDGSYCMLQATGLTSQDSTAVPLNLASVCGQLSDFFSHVNSVPPLPVLMFAQAPTDNSGSLKQYEGYYSDVTENEAKKKNNCISGMCAEKAPSAISGDLCRLAEDVYGPTTCRSVLCTSASIAGQQSYKVSSFLESGCSHGEIKQKKDLCEDPEILLPVKKKTRTFYSAEQLEELEKVFQEDRYPDNEKRREIAAVIGVTPQRIMVWFQNRRAKWRKTEKSNAKGSKKYSTSAALSVHAGSDSCGAPLLPVPPLPHQSAMLNVDTTAGNCSSRLSENSAFLASSSVSPVTAMIASCEAVQTKTLLQLDFSSCRVECFPSLPSPPPIHRASLPFSLSFSPYGHIVPLMLDAPNSECSSSSQENSSKEAFTYSIQNQGLCSPVSPEQLDFIGSLEKPYCQYGSQSGTYQLFQHPQQHQCSQFHRLPSHPPSNVSSIHLTSMTTTESSADFLDLPGSSGRVTYGPAGATQGYVQNHVGEQPVLQWQNGNSVGITDNQTVPWNDRYMQGALLLHQLRSQMPFSSTAGGQYFTEQILYTQLPCLPSSPYCLQLLHGTTLGSMPHTGKEKGAITSDQSSDQTHRKELELTSLAEREEIGSSIKKEEYCW
uniref:NOBOX oosis homeobox n=1 Tax=Gallus gallus TaxID=9031 RepID=A0A8V0ZTF9_CHICK